MADPERRIKVAVIFGVRSDEHAISCISASNVIAALDPQRYEVIPIGITREGHWVLQPEAASFAIGSTGELPEVGEGTEVVLSRNADLLLTDPTETPGQLGHGDVGWPVLHGPWGQDVTLQWLV